jgi:hypothetical protein
VGDWVVQFVGPSCYYNGDQVRLNKFNSVTFSFLNCLKFRVCNLSFNRLHFWQPSLCSECENDNRDICCCTDKPRLPFLRAFTSTAKIFSGLINTFGVHLLKYLNNISVFWHAIGTFSLVVAILAKAPTHQSGHFVFTTFIDGTGLHGVGWGERASHAYVVIIGILMAQYTMTG